MAGVSKEEYLKRYLSGGDAETKGKKKKKRIKKGTAKPVQSRVKIVDDDIDFGSLLPENIGNTLEDDVGDNEPTVAEFVDERPENVKQLETYRQDSRWKTLGSQESDSDDEPRSRARHDSDSEASPRRRHDSESGEERDSDQSPPRRGRMDSDSEQSPPRRKGRGSDSDQSPPRKKGRGSDSDQSPPRKASKSRRHDSESDQSPPRRRQRQDSDQSPPRRGRHDSDSDQSPPRRKGRGSDSDQSPPRRKGRGLGADQSPPRRKSRFSEPSPPRRAKKSRESEDRKRLDKSKTKDEVDDLGRAKKTLSGQTAGLSSAKQMREEAKKMKEREEKMFNEIGDEMLGKNAKTVFRKGGKRRDVEAEEAEKAAQKAAKDAQYKKWGKGLKQQEQQAEMTREALYEMGKTLARHKDDQDMNEYLKQQEREGDPMLAFLKKKKQKKRGPGLPRYKGPEPPPNRFKIWPGYRWDGVDRSNGFEKKIFSRANERKAMKELAHKWSTEDM